MASGSCRRRPGKSPSFPLWSSGSSLSMRELMPQQQQHWAEPKPAKLFCPSLEPPILKLDHLSTRVWVAKNRKKSYSLKSWSNLLCLLGQKNNVKKVFGASASGVAKSMAITSLALHSISRTSLLQRERGNMELLAFRREGSNKHIKGCKRASQQLKFEICALNNKERQRQRNLHNFMTWNPLHVP
ncbi:hypothetical protein R1flu_027209 [Riccia fluitans]|uniref:Uncharacterized protein n=1 Tax=Riccia fluitans TaxID=41844 RepID=A0ABD1XL63_9MARC